MEAPEESFFLRSTDVLHVLSVETRASKRLFPFFFAESRRFVSRGRFKWV